LPAGAEKYSEHCQQGMKDKVSDLPRLHFKEVLQVLINKVASRDDQ
jgi:hypothetical protein